MDPITASEYFKECQSIARELTKECEGNEEEIQDRLHETIDGHQWIIYTYYNLQVLTHSKNDGAYFEEYGPLQAKDFSDAVVKMAFAAFYADVSEELATALEWYKNPGVYTIEVRKPGSRYALVGTESCLRDAAWVLRQWLVAGSLNSVRVLSPDGEVVAKATPRK